MISLLPMYVVYCARFAQTQGAQWTRESLTAAYISWLSNLADYLRARGEFTTTILDGGYMHEDITSNLIQHLGMEPSSHTDEFLEALRHTIAISGSRPLGTPGHIWGRIRNANTHHTVSLEALGDPT
jgi:hypothetical protein